MEDPEREAPALGTIGGPVELRARGGGGALDRAQHLPGRPRGRRAGQRAGGAETIVMLRDITVARASAGDPGHVHRRPVARAADAGDDDLRRLEGPRPRRGPAAPRDAARDLLGHRRRVRAAPPARRGRHRDDPLRRGRGRRRHGAGPHPADPAGGHPLRGGPLAGRDVRARPAGPACPPRSPTRPTSSRSCGTCSRTRRSTAAPGRPSRSTSMPTRTRSYVRVTDDGPGLPRRGSGAGVRSVLPLAGHGGGGRRRGDRPVRLRPPHPGDGRPDLGDAGSRAAARSSGSRSG